MRTLSLRLVAGLAAVLGLLAATAGCGLQTAGGFIPSGTLVGDLEDAPDLSGVELSVGSKNFNENIILGKIALILLKSAGADVTDLTNIPGSASARQAHLTGDIDAMWEYTGTGWLQYLTQPDPIPDEEKQYEAVRDLDLERNDLVWLPPAPMNNTYAFAITEQSAQKYGITTLSEIAKVPVAERTFCVESEFRDRNDGLEGMLETYGIPLGSAQGVPESNLKTFQTGAIYDATASGNCVFGEVFTTDGRILALDLTVLEDDKRYFPNYNVSLVVRKELFDEHPEIEDLMAPVTAKLTNEELLAMNARVDVDGEEPTDVAYDWLVDNGFVE
ncbi:glycine betaine ABC transporter substrate-binding protein [Nocardioides humi]|uniref:Glycine betaine ABC transporter substrate-binding protein n=1 Tax=Nocardioides humi TaxID=449461 RepID=A0ABN2AIW4_9ACTN|nr:glycine betaine ABC transporter substrate-binding protein [Nocardioides humi]